MIKNIQDSIIETIKIIAGEALKNINFTKSYTGKVKNVDFESLTCIVDALGQEYECIIPINLKSFIQQDDIVIIQDIANTKAQRIVQGVISSENQYMFHIYDPIADVIVSSIIQLWDEDIQSEVNVILEME